ncbi:telomere repeat-binding protein 3-like [Neltuma alba]|uniref:telomere repeat-binding protein 3-like n=1 Tax=Neltuma alba TaxID=207710 RepID=UPI0010A5873B|nr:telomere repeat-binding protein 3-like [Prosopis alba]XP_028776188.1 telomere repeat-binding protein 3-like [Prosopis alba]XP_028791562.1 telomere repeat-binding protein 3-like [Prosopis alba]XP_028791563.1 telomere repeat-binding protein 3-like [Prosopis alba]
MVCKKRLEYGFNGFQVPFIPRAPRSVRRRVLSKKEEDGQVCAIEVLASLAGKLLQESESSASSNASEGNHQPASGQGAVEQESQGEAKPLVAEGVHHGSCAESAFMTEVVSRNSSQKYLGQAETDAVPECTSVTNPADCCKKTEPNIKPKICKWEDQAEHYSSRLAESPQNFRESYNNSKINNGFKREQEARSSGIEGPSLADKCSMKDPLEFRVNSHSISNSVSKIKYPFSKGTFPNSSFSNYGNNSKVGFRDDDDNFIRCHKISTKSKSFKPPHRIAHRRIRKLVTSKYWKVAPKLKDCELSRSDAGAKPLFQKRKACHSFERGHYDSLFKRRKFSNRFSGLTLDGGFSSESVSNSIEKGMDGNNPSSSSKHESKDSHVKFSIKSFKIPELYIEVPETATVGSLKRTVMEAVMAILGGGVHVGVVLQGKKVRDDNRTLQQTGLSCEENIDALGFTLEPSSLQGSPSVCVGEPSYHEPSHSNRSPRTPVLESGITDVLHDSPLLTTPSNPIESNHESISSPTDTMTDKVASDSKSLVVVPDRSTEPLAIVPATQKTKRSELVQRRTRRPFSVSEVEALVHAVEELGTGRWRDVKLLAFENADHRTYVDLKDKWKTLVHTARISPQQRRGEPVPQELLDRVLAAHAFWSQHQGKQQHGKHHHQQQHPATPNKVKESSAPQGLSVVGEAGGVIQPVGTM